ncbi:hypothetical protein HaLaN_17135, partial [Haematococcus lacustris]
SSTPQQLHASGLPPGLALGLLLLITQASGDAASAADTATALTGLQAAESASLLAPNPSQEGDPLDGLAAALTPGTSPSQANGLLAVAQLAVGLGLPAIALAAVQVAAAELPASCALPQVKLELDLAAAQAYCTIHCWEVAQLPATEQTLAAAEQQAACASAASSSSTADYDTSSSDREAAREAAAQDPEEPRVWAQLALAALRAQRWSEVHVAMAAAMRLGLSDPILLQQA